MPDDNGKLKETVDVAQTSTRNAPINESYLERLKTVPGFPRGYHMDNTGVWAPSQEKGKPESDDTVTVVQILRTPIVVSAMSRPGEPEKDTATYQYILAGIDVDENYRELVFDKGFVSDRSSSLVTRLDNLGFDTVYKMDREIAKYFKSFDDRVLQRRRRIMRSGWHEVEDGRLAFVFPTGKSYGGSPEGEQLELEKAIRDDAQSRMKRKGKLRGWKENVAAYAQGNPLMIFCLSVAFAGPLLQLLNAEGVGFHLWGNTSKGKTTSQQLAASVYGYGDTKDSSDKQPYIRGWGGTEGALQKLAAKHNDLLLVLDEVKQSTCSSENFGRIVYGLANGFEKERLGRDITLRRRDSWAIVYLSSGEVSAHSMMKSVKGGQTLRLLDIPVQETEIVQNSHGMEPKDFVKMLKANCRKYYGVAGPHFIRALVDSIGEQKQYRNYDHVRLLERWQELSATLQRPGMDSAMAGRALDHFALVALAGVVARNFGILPFRSSEIVSAVELVRDLWFSENMRLSDTEKTVLAIRDFIQSQRVRFQDWDVCDAKVPINRVGFYRTLNGKGMYLLYPTEFDGLCINASRNEVCKLLVEFKLLETNNSGGAGKDGITRNKHEVRFQPPKHLAGNGFPTTASRTGNIPSGKWPFYAIREQILTFTDLTILAKASQSEDHIPSSSSVESDLDY